ncbi:MAG: hypothetical protein M0D54_16425 [Hyphomonadaceae bacterium JAD_PAG50586_4]|nr:MAG: hypothetical protein M0D54_16425 [Hyphomonadaceae bacterium JAD_PAG50586_4]
MLKTLARAALVACALSVAACAGGARPENIAASVQPAASFDASHQLHEALAVRNVQGGSDTNPLWMSNISDEQFRAGLEQSLRNAGLLADSPALARYEVVASLQDLRRPMAGLDMTVTMTVRYSLVPIGGGEPIFDEVVSASGTGRMSDAFVGVERLRIANEAAARENISEFLRRLRDRVPAATVAPVS